MNIVCAWCGKIISDDPIDTRISHGICPDCVLDFRKEEFCIREEVVVNADDDI